MRSVSHILKQDFRYHSNGGVSVSVKEFFLTLSVPENFQNSSFAVPKFI